MFLSNKNVFWESLIIAFVIFWIGIILGILFEGSRANKLEKIFFGTETDIFDIQLNGEVLSMFNFNCETSLKENILFADRIYFEARELEKYDAATRITEDIVKLHKRYDLLRVMLWINIIRLQEECPNITNSVVYLYEYDEPRINKQAIQVTLSKVLLDLKKKYGDKVVLIPIADDTNIHSLDLLKSRYGITKSPAVIVNQKHKVTDLITLEELEKLLFEKPNEKDDGKAIHLN